jgi:hypothetical protein
VPCLYVGCLKHIRTPNWRNSVGAIRISQVQLGMKIQKSLTWMCSLRHELDGATQGKRLEKWQVPKSPCSKGQRELRGKAKPRLLESQGRWLQDLNVVASEMESVRNRSKSTMGRGKKVEMHRQVWASCANQNKALTNNICTCK